MWIISNLKGFLLKCGGRRRMNHHRMMVLPDGNTLRCSLSVHVLRELLAVLLLGLHLEGHNVSRVFCDALVVANVNFLGTLRDQTHVVRNHQHPAFEFVDALSQCIDRVDIQRICGFVDCFNKTTKQKRRLCEHEVAHPKQSE